MTPQELNKPGEHVKAHQSFWLWVMCLTGVDYFSTLGYQPSIAFEATGLLTPFATVILVLVTLFGAFPVYAYVAGKSPHGHGSIAMLERLLAGWKGKLLVLVLLGFAATDFVITKTLSAADAAVHLLENPLCPAGLKGSSTAQILVTMGLLVALGAMFFRGFKEVIGLAAIIVGVYLLLNTIVVGSSLKYLYEHPGALERWSLAVESGDWHIEHNPLGAGTGWWHIALVCLVLFPKLALGLSGFETGVAVMPLIKGKATDTHADPRGRIRNTRKLLLTAALVMSVYLLASSLVVTTLIEPDQLHKGGRANGRALAYLAHGDRLTTGETGDAINPVFGEAFGTLYDLSTVVILWFAGASAMAGLLNLLPQYLPRYGMAPEWSRTLRPLVVLFTVINLIVTWRFDADVEAQGAAYATGVLVLMSSACVATVIDRWRARSGFWLFRLSWYFLFVTVVFLFTTLANIIEKPDGLKIAAWFILTIVFSSVISRLARSKELRFQGFTFTDEHSHFLWDSMRLLEFPVLVPHRPGTHSLPEKEAIIRREHRIDPEVPIVFLKAHLGDASDFYQSPKMEVTQEEGRFLLRVTRCIHRPHHRRPGPGTFEGRRAPRDSLRLVRGKPHGRHLSFLLFGEGNVPWMVRELILQAEADPSRQPRVIIG